MKTFITILATLVTLATARPEAGYSSGVPSGGGGYGSGNSGFSSGGTIAPGLSSGPISSGGYGGGYNSPSVAPIVQKHVYVHAAPPEVDDRTPQPLQKIAPPKKHYKLVFIKAPTPPPPTVPVLPVVPQDSEKTLIYVLVKKPEEQPAIIVPTLPPTQPPKPEVFFIKYKTQQKEAGPDGGYDVSSPSSLYGSPSPSPSSGYGAPSTSGSY